MANGKDSRSGTTQGRVHTVFQNRLTDLKDRADNHAKAWFGEELRKWDLPPELVTDLLDVPTLHTPAHDRTEINTNFEQITASTASAGTTGDGISLIYQCDLVASEERALRMRHSTLARSFGHACGRRRGLGKGQTFDNMRTQAERSIQAGGSGG